MTSVEMFNRNRAFINSDPSMLYSKFNPKNLNPGRGINPTGMVVPVMGGGITFIPYGYDFDKKIKRKKQKGMTFYEKDKVNKLRNMPKRELRRVLVKLKGKGIATALLAPLLTAGISALSPVIIKGVSSAFNWLTKKNNKRGKGFGDIYGVNKNKLMKTGEGIRLRKVLKKMKKFGAPLIHKLVKHIASDETAWKGLAGDSVPVDFIMQLVKAAANLIDPYMEKWAAAEDEDEEPLKEEEKKGSGRRGGGKKKKYLITQTSMATVEAKDKPASEQSAQTEAHKKKPKITEIIIPKESKGTQTRHKKSKGNVFKGDIDEMIRREMEYEKIKDVRKDLKVSLKTLRKLKSQREENI